MSTKTKQPVLRNAVREGVAAARANALPGALLICCGVVLVVCYYQLDVVHDALTRLGEWKDRHGLAYSMPATAFFGGIMPILFRLIFFKRKFTLADFIFQVCFWAFLGLQVDLFYALQAKMFGHGSHWRTVLCKVFVDQFVYVPLAAVPQMILGYLWKDNGYSLKRTREALKRRSYWDRSIPLMISNWAIWVPAVFIIYTFPLPLQMPLQNLILSIWVLLVMLIAGDSEQT